MALSAAAPAAEQSGVQRSEHHAYRVVRVVEGLDHPWGMAFLPDGRMLITERSGHLRIVRAGQLVREPVAGVPEVHARGQGGLLDVALHPDFARNHLVYLSYSKPGPRGATTAVIRGRFDGARLADVEEIFEADAWRSGGPHYGSRLAFDRNGFLFITVGERGQMQKAQELSNHHGKHIRLHDDGRVPSDNPFVGRTGARPEIWTYGNRNPQGLAIHPGTGAVYSVEHGARGGDELNLIEPGRNYGWPVITWGINYDGRKISDHAEMEGMEQPLHYWVPSIATSGLAIYDGDRFPRWRGDFFVGGLAGEHLARLRFDGRRRIEHERLLEGYGRIRDVRVGPDGLLYVLVDDDNAPLLRLEPADARQ
jgi:glucose/arabinose dehydrogenase